MAFFPDLAACTYFGPGNTSRLKAVGWLEHGHPFNQGTVSPEATEGNLMERRSLMIEGFKFTLPANVEEHYALELFKTAKRISGDEFKKLRQEYFDRGRAERGKDFCSSDIVSPADAPYGFYPVRNAVTPTTVVVVRYDLREMFVVQDEE